jgi:hypothetical protein
MTNLEETDEAGYDTYQTMSMSSNSSLSDCLSTLLSRACEANKLGKDESHNGNLSREDHVLYVWKPSGKQKLAVSPQESSTVTPY